MQPANYYIYEMYILKFWNRLRGNECIDVDDTLEVEGFPLEIEQSTIKIEEFK